MAQNIYLGYATMFIEIYEVHFVCINVGAY